MKPLIFSFFAIILCYSLLTNNNEEKMSEPAPPAVMDENSVYFEVLPSLQPVDSTSAIKEPIAGLLQL